MSERDSTLLIGDIIESGEKIIHYTKGLSFDEFIAESMVVDAVVRNFEIIGEAANRLPSQFKDQSSEKENFRVIRRAATNWNDGIHTVMPENKR